MINQWLHVTGNLSDPLIHSVEAMVANLESIQVNGAVILCTLGTYVKLPYELEKITFYTGKPKLTPGHSFHHPWPHRIRIGPNWDLSKALNNRYHLLLLRPILRTFWGSTYKNTPFGFCGCSHKVDNKTENLEKTVFLKPSFESCTKQQCWRTDSNGWLDASKGFQIDCLKSYIGHNFLEGYYFKICIFFSQSLTVDSSYMVHCRDPNFFPLALNYLLAPGNVFFITLILDGGTMWLWGKMCAY